MDWRSLVGLGVLYPGDGFEDGVLGVLAEISNGLRNI
jgi:hypothetical protein